jgi:hypothetical protein
MPGLVSNGLPRSGTTAQRPTNAEVGQSYFDETLGVELVYTGADGWKPAGGFFAKEVTFTETAGAGTYTGSVAIPAGATIVDVIVYGEALWDNAGAVTMKVGLDGLDDDGFFTGVNLKATDLLAGESISFALAGGKAGADIANSQVMRRYLATARTLSGIITTASTGGTAGRTRMTVLYTLPTVTVATKV